MPPWQEREQEEGERSRAGVGQPLCPSLRPWEELGREGGLHPNSSNSREGPAPWEGDGMRGSLP